MYQNFLIHSSVDGYLGCFHVLGIVNNAAMNIEARVSFSIMVSSVYMLSSGAAGSYLRFIPIFLRNLHTVFHIAVSVYICPNSAEGFPILYTLSRTYGL